MRQAVRKHSERGTGAPSQRGRSCPNTSCQSAGAIAAVLLPKWGEVDPAYSCASNPPPPRNHRSTRKALPYITAEYENACSHELWKLRGVLPSGASESSPPNRSRTTMQEIIESHDPSNHPAIRISDSQFDAAIFDMDGVVTKTAKLHAKAWKATFDEFLGSRYGSSYEPFALPGDYLRYVDGKSRTAGTASFLASRGIDLPFGGPDDPSDAETIIGVSKRKNCLFWKLLEERGVEAYQSTIDFLWQAKNAGWLIAVISASRNARTILRAAGLLDLFDAAVDGTIADALHLKSKPEPDIFLEAARRLDISPERAIVFEDALAGVSAARNGEFGLVIGVDRGKQALALMENGADAVVDDLSEVELCHGSSQERSHGRPHP